jgi:hypothetical protein
MTQAASIEAASSNYTDEESLNRKAVALEIGSQKARSHRETERAETPAPSGV